MTLTEIVYKIRSDGFPWCQATAKAPEVKAIFNQTSWDSDTQSVKGLATIIGPGPKAAEVVRQLDTVWDKHDIVRQAKDQVSARVSTSMDSLRRTSNPHAFALEYFGDSAVMGPNLYRDGYLHTRFVVTGKVDLSSLLGDYEKGVKAGRWSDFKLVRIDDYDPEQQVYGAFTENLTQKQLEVIKTALALGFYNTPRDVTLDDLSNIFGISKAAVHNRLQAAERKVIAKFFA